MLTVALAVTGFVSVTPAGALTGGVVAHAADYPYIAAIQYHVGGVYTGLCQGALIRQDVVVTAAHCIYDSAAPKRDVAAGEVSVWLGADNMSIFGTEPPNPGAELYKVLKIDRDKRYDGNIAHGQDLALLQLERPAASRFHPLLLPVRADAKEAKRNSNYVAEGYMNTAQRILRVGVEQGVDLPVRCKIGWRADSIYVSQKGVQFPSGDSGGGLTAVLGGVTKLVGVLSGSPFGGRFLAPCPDAFTDLRDGTDPRKWLNTELNSLPPSPPSVPQSVTATSISGGIRLSWSAPASNGTGPLIGYTVHWDDGKADQVRQVPPSQTSIDIVGFPAGFTVAADVAAHYSIGLSAPVSATAQAGSSNVLTISTVSLPVLTAGSTYGATLSAAGGTGPYAWSIVGGTLPGDLALNSDGTFSGLAYEAGDSTLTFKVVDGTGETATKDLLLSVVEPKDLTFLLTDPLIVLSLHCIEPSSQQLHAVGGNRPYSWAVVSGTLPDGVSMNSDGLLSMDALPGAVLKQTVQIQVSDATGAKVVRTVDVAVENCF